MNETSTKSVRPSLAEKANRAAAGKSPVVDRILPGEESVPVAAFNSGI